MTSLEISSLLDTIRGIEAIHKRNNRAVVEVDMKGDAEALVEALLEELIIQDFKNYKVKVTDFSANRLNINVHYSGGKGL